MAVNLNKFLITDKLHTLRRSLNVLSPRDQFKVLLATLVQVSITFLDLLGVIAIGLLVALSTTSLQLRNPEGKMMTALRFLHLDSYTFQSQIIVLGSSSVILLVGRTFLSIYFTRRTLFFLSRRGATVSASLISRLISQSLITIQARTKQETLFAITRGVDLIVLQVIAYTVILIADIALLIVMSAGLFVIDPLISAGTILVFSVVGYLLFKYMHVRAGVLGMQSSELNISSNQKIIEVIETYRESVVRNRRFYYANEIEKLRNELADTTAEMNFMPYVSKYIIESVVIVGTLAIGFVQFMLHDAIQATSTMAIFFAAGARITPSLLRVQQGIMTIRMALGQSKPTLDLIDDLASTAFLEKGKTSLDLLHIGFDSRVNLSDVSFKYPNKIKNAVENFTLEISSGKFIAIVGPSGAGKTTAVDILLGVLKPNKGTVLISGLPPLSTYEEWPGAVSYVPQDTVIINGSIRENVSLGFSLTDATDDLVVSALKIANLYKYVLELPQGLDTQVGDGGSNLSGGQRQRLGIARAMFTQPHLVVLDESTSSLDVEAEASISDSLLALKGSVTVVMIAHRLSTIRNADSVVYIDNGKIMAVGTFEEVRSSVRDFDHQAKLMGL